VKKLVVVALFVGIAAAVVKYSTAAGQWHDAEATDHDFAGA
jgi:hypothetical protein